MKRLTIFIVFIVSTSLMAMAPLTIGDDVSEFKSDSKNLKMRYPAQQGLSPLENYHIVNYGELANIQFEEARNTFVIAEQIINRSDLGEGEFPILMPLF